MLGSKVRDGWLFIHLPEEDLKALRAGFKEGRE
jgi:hypothetical protein